MRIMKQALLAFLATLPVASISVAANAQLGDMAGEEQIDLLRAKISEARAALFDEGSLTTSFEDAKKRISEQTGVVDDAVLDQEVSRHVQILLQNGLIETDEKKIMARGPSAWG